MDTQRHFCDDRIFLFHGGRVNGREAYADIRPLVFIFNRQKKFLEPGRGASLGSAKPDPGRHPTIEALTFPKKECQHVV